MEIKYNEPQFVKKTENPNLEDVLGFFPVVTTAPTWSPKKLYEQIAIYTTGGVATRLYIYDTINNAWRYATLT